MATRIAICDDQPDDLARLKAALSEYLRRIGQEAQLQTFDNADSLLEAARERPYDLYVLDIVMPVVDGLATVRELRGLQGEVPVVFVSASREYALEAFAVNAVGYLQKPWMSEHFSETFDHVFALMRVQETKCLVLPTVAGYERVNAERLNYVTSEIGNQIALHFDDGSVKVIRHALSSFCTFCAGKVQLVQAGRALLVNPRRLAALSGTEARFRDGAMIRIPRRGISAVREAVLGL